MANLLSLDAQPGSVKAKVMLIIVSSFGFQVGNAEVKWIISEIDDKFGKPFSKKIR